MLWKKKCFILDIILYMINIYNIKTTESKNEKVKAFYDKAMKELIDFYGINWIDNAPVIYLVDSRIDFDIVSGSKTESWVVGKALDYNKLLLLSPESYERESIHKYSDDEYYFLLKHELSHLFYTIFSQGKGPVWLDEGFALYTSGELVTKKRPESFRNFIKYYFHEDKDVYAEPGFVVEGLIKKYGKEKVLSFLKLLPNMKDEKGFNRGFKDYFEMNLDYPSIQELL